MSPYKNVPPELYKDPMVRHNAGVAEQELKVIIGMANDAFNTLQEIKKAKQAGDEKAISIAILKLEGAETHTKGAFNRCKFLSPNKKLILEAKKHVDNITEIVQEGRKIKAE